ncbi:MAG TPA: winged helix-turn-helix domain-containing protein [Thermoguttaceae bacterium]|nr:winged helix-turn-helix domain-containing protein [Thermoguttaceae bacterium]
MAASTSLQPPSLKPDEGSVRGYFEAVYIARIGLRLAKRAQQQRRCAVGIFERAGFARLEQLTRDNIETALNGWKGKPGSRKVMRGYLNRLREHAVREGRLPAEPGPEDDGSVRGYFEAVYVPRMGARLRKDAQYHMRWAVGISERTGFARLEQLTPENLGTLMNEGDGTVKTRRDARGYLNRLREHAVREGRLAAPPGPENDGSVRGYFEAVCLPKMGSRVTNSTRAGMRWAVGIWERAGFTGLDQLTPDNIETALNGWKGTARSRYQLRSHLTKLRAQAVREGRLPAEPAPEDDGSVRGYLEAVYFPRMASHLGKKAQVTMRWAVGVLGRAGFARLEQLTAENIGTAANAWKGTASGRRTIRGCLKRLREHAAREGRLPAIPPEPGPEDDGSVRGYFEAVCFPKMASRLAKSVQRNMRWAIGVWERAGSRRLEQLTPESIEAAVEGRPKSRSQLRSYLNRLREHAVRDGRLPADSGAEDDGLGNGRGQPVAGGEPLRTGAGKHGGNGEEQPAVPPVDEQDDSPPPPDDDVLVIEPGGFRLYGVKVPLSGKPLQVLERFVESRDRLVTCKQLHESVWKGVVVTDDTVRAAVKDLRRGLRGAMRKARIEKRSRPEDPVRCVDRGRNLAWQLDLRPHGKATQISR